MTNTYRWVQWNRHKRIYDAALALACAGFVGIFVGVGSLAYPAPGNISAPVLVIRALGLLAIVLLHVILLIGPLSRMTPLVAPLLYNRRHLGVTFFLVALAHGTLSLVYYGGFGVRDPVSAVLAGYGSFGSVSGFPFEILGFAALLIFFVMAATSHDFWLANLSARVWKSVHMLVYVAYGLVVLHVALGALQSEQSPVYAALLIGGAALVGATHAVAGFSELARDGDGVDVPTDGAWLDAGPVGDLDEGGARVVCVNGRERLAIVRHNGTISAVSNVCAHQGGPLGEGRVVDGCLTCPWHGYQYRPADGRSPPPFTEKIPTYGVRLEGGRVLVSPNANPPGTPVEPARIPEDAS